MKLFQKLRDDAAKKHFQLESTSISSRLFFKKGYELGFMKAREMAAAALYEAGCDPTGFGEDTIRLIGEQEI
jgi:hypothetical protein